ncbi:protein-glutamine glutaminase family protein [Myxococcus fulvus]|uniref:protein-glutamine glutaminase family protein n=1 Tax=Myxococcus fulvus TaxID=33 RepID=UPI003B9B6BCD
MNQRIFLGEQTVHRVLLMVTVGVVLCVSPAYGQAKRRGEVEYQHRQEPLAPMGEADAQGFYDFVTRDVELDWSYPNGNCHARAEAVRLILEAGGGKTSKVWLFSESKLAPFQAASELRLRGKPASYPSWGYHVATMVGGRTTGSPRVLDALVSDHPIPLKDWLARFDCNNCVWFTTKSNVYNFNNSGAVATGTFYRCDGDNCMSQHWLEEDLAVLDVAAHITKQGTHADLVSRISNIEDCFKQSLGNACKFPDAKTTYAPFYEKRLEHWKSYIARVRAAQAARITGASAD